MTTLGVITARGGSKGIANKNIATLGGKPLMAYTIEAALGSKLLTRFVVSTDDESIATVARDLGAEVPFLRPQELATDDASSVDVVAHALRWLKEQDGKTFDYVMILQPTSPLRTSEDIDACIRMAEKTGADSVMSMMEIPDFAPQKLKTIRDGQIFPLLQEEKRISAARTDGPNVYKRNCAIYLTKSDLILKGEQFGKKSMAYIMPHERSIDINDPVDLELAEFWLKKK